VISLQEAQEFVLSHIHPLSPRILPVSESLGLLLAHELTSTIDVPGFDNTAVDGYAVHSDDLAQASPENPVELKVSETVAAGTTTERVLESGWAVRIMTGAKLPNGADAVVMVEDTVGSPTASTVRVTSSIEVGANIRRRGSDFLQGQALLAELSPINPATVGVFASLGINALSVYPRPRVGVISTGSELSLEDELADGHIRDSNRPSLLASLALLGATPVDLGLVSDDRGALSAAFENAAATCDAVITSGGVSVGDFDLTKIVLEELSEGSMRWMQIAIRPAKPFAFGLIGSTPLFGLPGNPVSALVSFELLAAPALRMMMGSTVPFKATLIAEALESLHGSSDGRTSYLRGHTVVVDGRLTVRTTGEQGSHVLSAMGRSNALVIVEPDQTIQPGENCSIVTMDHWQASPMPPSRSVLGSPTR
jgi:molybdopterin molybdotransferase